MQEILTKIFLPITIIIGFIVAEISLFHFDIFTKTSVSWAWGLNFIVFIVVLSFSNFYFFKKSKEPRKKFSYIEAKVQESGNKVFWFKSNYPLNKGDILKLIERDKNCTDNVICIAKVQFKNEDNSIGLLSMISSKELDRIASNESKSKNINFIPINIDIDDLINLFKEKELNSYNEKEK
jgi:hypothetical protein